MAFSFPLSLADFFGGLRLLRCDMEMPPAVERHRSANGEIHEAYLGSRLWEGTATVAPMPIRDAEGVRAKLTLLRQPGASFLIHPFPVYRPKLDKFGTILGGSTPTVHTLNVNNREMRLQGVPAGYTLSRGDYLSIAYGSSPTRYGLHQVVSGTVVADGSGVTPLFEVVSNIRPGAAVGNPVTLLRPVMKAMITDVDFGAIAGAKRYGISFSFIQKVK